MRREEGVGEKKLFLIWSSQFRSFFFIRSRYLVVWCQHNVLGTTDLFSDFYAKKIFRMKKTILTGLNDLSLVYFFI